MKYPRNSVSASCELEILHEEKVLILLNRQSGGDLQSQRHQKRATVFPVTGLQCEDDIPPFSILRCFDFRFYANLVFDFTPATLLTIAFRYSEIIRNYRKAAKGHKKARPEKGGRPGGLRKGKRKSAMKGYLVASLESLLFGITQNLSSG